MPMRCAYCTTVSMPTSSASFTVTTFTESFSASRRFIGPRKSPL